MSRLSSFSHNAEMTLKDRFTRLSWFYVFLVCMVAASGLVVLYSAANGNWNPWASKQFVRFCLGFGVMIVVGMTNLRFWLKYAYAFYTVKRTHDFLHSCRACRTRHARYVEFLFFHKFYLFVCFSIFPFAIARSNDSCDVAI